MGAAKPRWQWQYDDVKTYVLLQTPVNRIMYFGKKMLAISSAQACKEDIWYIYEQYKVIVLQATAGDLQDLKKKAWTRL